MPGGLDPPPEVIASWKPNYVNPELQGEGIVYMEIALTVLCFLVVGLRIYTRVFLSKSYGWDDTVIIFNLLPLTAMAASLCLAMTNYGWNRHIWDIPLDMLYSARKMGLTIQITYLVSTVATKVSILLFYRRLTSRVSTRFKLAVYFTIAFNLAFCVAGNLTMFLGCRPFRAYWLSINPFWVAENKGKYYCYDEGLYIIIAATISMVTDFVVCILPMALFRHLKIELRQKLALIGIFGVGFFLCICGVLRMEKIVRTYHTTYDITWSSMPVWIWTGIEAHMAVVIASLPALNHFFRQTLNGSSFGSRMRSIASRKQGSGYDRTQSQGTSVHEGTQTNSGFEKHKSGIHIVQEVHLEEFVRDPSYDQEQQSRFNIGNHRPRHDRRAWLDEGTSDEEELNRRSTKF